MESQKPTLTQFIESYARHSASRDFPALVAQFAESFLVAGPGGAQCVRAANFAKVLPRRTEWFQSAGCEAADLVDMAESWLDGRYAVVRTLWRFRFRRNEDCTETIDSESIFLVDTGTDPYQFLLYLNPRDILETMRERGLVS